MVPIDLGEVRFGGSVERVRFGYRLEPLAATAVTQVSAMEEQLETTVAGMFAEWEGSVAPDVRVRAGLRGDLFTHQGGARVGPRLEVGFTLTDRAVLVASGGRYHQVLPAPGLRTETADGAPAAIAWEPRLPVVSASHLVVGLEQELDGGFRLGVAGFVKGFSGLGARGDRTRSSGTELRVNRSGERVKAWLGYALSWSWTEEVRGGTTRFDGRHLVSLGVEGTLGGFELGSTLGYGAGLPLSAVEVVGTSGDRGRADAEGFAPTTENRLNAGGGETPLELAPQDDFLRLDLEAAWPFALTVWGWPVEMRPYLKVLNALDRRDALFYYFDRWREEGLTPVTSRPFVPLVGVEWRF
jgi:hypothetical protein